MAADPVGTSTPQTASFPDSVPGGKRSIKTSVLETLSSIAQGFAPIKSIHQHLCGIHFYAHDLTRQVEVHHFCTHLSEDMQQCLLYDSDGPDARLVGIEYVITADLFKGLPEEEKKLWHSHAYEVKGGSLFLPGGLPKVLHTPAELAAMRQLANTYGKTWHFWQFDRGDTVPLGIPQLMMGLTSDGQSDPLLERRVLDKYGVDKSRLVEERANIPVSPVDPAADAWRSGKSVQLELKETDFKAVPGANARPEDANTL